MLPVVRDKIVEREAVMAGHKINALLRLPFFMTVDFRAADQTVGEMCQRTFFATEEITGIVPKPPIPFLPAISDKRTDLVQPGSIPGFRDEFRPGQEGVRVNVPEDGRIP